MTELLDVIHRMESLGPQRRKAIVKLIYERGNQFGIHALSSAQRGMWFVCSVDEALPLYNVPYSFRLTGAVNRDALRLAVEELVRRHEALRTVFFDIDGEPFQAVVPAVTIPFAIRDWPLRTAEDEANLLTSLNAEACIPFDLRRGPLIRAGLLTGDGRESVFFLTLHHIVCDGWSMAILFKDLGELYSAFYQHRPPQLAGPVVGFADAVRRQEMAELASRADRLRYWRTQLAGAPSLLVLPADYPRPAVQSHQGDQEIFLWEAGLRESIEGFAAGRRVTVFMTMLAVFVALLHRYTTDDDIVVGAPVAGRYTMETESLVGLFVNMVALRLRPESGMSFSALLGQVREVTLAAQAHQELPFDLLVESLNLPRRLDRHPLFQVCFVVLEAENEVLRLPGLASELVPRHTNTSKFDLCVSLIAVPGGLRGVVEYDNQLFRRDTVLRMVAGLRSLVSAALATPDRDIGALPLEGQDGS
jgi:hypothetical protein